MSKYNFIVTYNVNAFQEIVTTISKQLEARPILLKIFKCMKCSTQFSQDAEYVRLAITSTTGLFIISASLKLIPKVTILSGAKQFKCPACNSSLVIEMETSPNADGQIVDNFAGANLQHSESFSSIGKRPCVLIACKVFRAR